MKNLIAPVLPQFVFVLVPDPSDACLSVDLQPK